QTVRNSGMFVKVIIKFPGKEIANELPHAFTTFFHVLRAQFCFCLAFEYRFDHSYRNRSYNTGTYIRSVIIFLVKVADGFYICLAESLLVRTALRRMLTVHKAVNILAVVVVMGNGHFDIVARHVYDRVTY